MRLLIQIFLLLLFASCTTQQKKKQDPITKKKSIVVLQALQFTDTTSLQLLKDSIEIFYPVTVYIAPDKNFPEHIYYKPRNRYRADRIIHWLRMNIADSVKTIVGITALDISTTKNNVYDYGVMGLGYRPGHACVVSTFRAAKTAKSKMHLQQRLLKLVIHELGHNFGLPHCSNKACFMVDAEGQMKLDQERYLCGSCTKRLND
ncbi:MAG: zinc-dependent metalloprotease family protein [Chitinophagaceae bacterium]|jgi:archaemetzincin